MDESARTVQPDINRASRKAEEAAWRRFQAAEWLERLVGPLGMSKQPSEGEFISCLRNGLVLCNAINKIQPGAVAKVVENPAIVQSSTWDSQPLPAYQYFENVRNFLVAVEELKLPAFEASAFERDALDVGSAAKVVDCILALKCYHEGKQLSGTTGFPKFAKSPMVLHSANKIPSRGSSSLESCSQLDMSAACEKQPSSSGETNNIEDLIVKVLSDRLVNSKENIDNNLLVSCRNKNMDPIELFRKLISNCLDEPNEKIIPELTSLPKDPAKESDRLHANSTVNSEELSATEDGKHCRACFRVNNNSHGHAILLQEREVLDLKLSLSKTKTEFVDLKSWMQREMRELESWVGKLSIAALGYHKVLKENRYLHNMVQDLKGNIRVYCRIRPSFSSEPVSVVDFFGGDGSMVVSDPSKPNKDGKKVFQFNQVFGPMASQDDVYKDTQPLIRSVMDGYNVCIFAYGQTGSGKTHTMSGPSNGSGKEVGINYMALSDLFEISDSRRDVISYNIHVQMVEIYNEQVRDLLVEDSINSRLEIRSCTGDDGLSIPDATMCSVKSTSDVLDLMKLGELNRVMGATAMNNRSSRSHSILTVHVNGKDSSGGILRSCLHLVDLAGSERVDKSEVIGDRLKEAQFINKSLSCLGDVITALAHKNSHIPYRNSKLTLLLQKSLGGHAKTLMFAHVSPEVDSFGETISTLKFAQRVSTVELGAARLNKESSEVIKLKQEFESLKNVLAYKEAQSVNVSGTDLSSPRYRRMSLESCITLRTEERKGLKTPSIPTRVRRLSLESPGYTKRVNLQTKTPGASIENYNAGKTEDKTGMNSRSRRLSLEGPGYSKRNDLHKKMPDNINPAEDNTGMKTGSRRFSLEGPGYSKRSNLHPKMPDNINKPLMVDAQSLQKRNQFQDAEAVSGSNSTGGTLAETLDHSGQGSPLSSAYQKNLLKTDGKSNIPRLRRPKSPEPSVIARDKVETITQSETNLSTGLQTSNLDSSTSGRGSQFKKSLRNNGKLINDPEKRNQHSLLEIHSGTMRSDERGLPCATSTRNHRRQSLSVVQESKTCKPRRSSLGAAGNAD